ncbi:MAG: cupredoxin domain-containing protein [Chamaesiphon sp.]|nr:cupredoxin domain-containing protein [Chamaesiphon sp.]
MVSRSVIMATIATVGVSIGLTASGAIAQTMREYNQPTTTTQTREFQRIEQPLSSKILVTTGGLGLIAVELWWFLFSKPKSRKLTAQAGIQTVTITVDGGYEPSYIVVKTGQPVRLNFDRQDPSSCLEEIRLPEFRIAKTLPIDRITPIDFTPNKPGKYEFTCGMNMFRGTIEVQPPTNK